MFFKAYSQKDRESFTDYISFYQNNISQLRGGECQMYPSCSNYGHSLFKNENIFNAFVLTSDRLLRCSHDRKNYEIIIHDNKLRLLDLPPNDKTFNITNKTINTYPSLKTDTCSYKFIDYLILEKEYVLALLEIEKLLYTNVLCTEVYADYIKCKRALNQSEDAIFRYDNSFSNEIKNNDLILLEIGNCYMDLEEFSTALNYYNKLEKSNDTNNKQKGKILTAIAFLEDYKFDEAKISFNAIPTTSQYYYTAQNSVNMVNDLINAKKKNEAITGMLSIIPGLGYLYTGHKSSALSSFIVNGLLAYGLYTSVKTENYGMAALVGVFSFSFYVGNISGSISSAKRYNDNTYTRIINQIKSNIIY